MAITVASKAVNRSDWRPLSMKSNLLWDGPPKTQPRRQDPSPNEFANLQPQLDTDLTQESGDPLREPKDAEWCKKMRGATKERSL